MKLKMSSTWKYKTHSNMQFFFLDLLFIAAMRKAAKMWSTATDGDLPMT